MAARGVCGLEASQLSAKRIGRELDKSVSCDQDQNHLKGERQNLKNTGVPTTQNFGDGPFWRQGSGKQRRDDGQSNRENIGIRSDPLEEINEETGDFVERCPAAGSLGLGGGS